MEYLKSFFNLLLAVVILPILGSILVAKVWDKFGHLETAIASILVIVGYLWLIDVLAEDD